MSLPAPARTVCVPDPWTTITSDLEVPLIVPELETIVAFLPSQLSNGEADAGDVKKSAGATKNVETPTMTERLTIRDVINDVVIPRILGVADQREPQRISKIRPRNADSTPSATPGPSRTPNTASFQTLPPPRRTTRSANENPPRELRTARNLYFSLICILTLDVGLVSALGTTTLRTPFS